MRRRATLGGVLTIAIVVAGCSGTQSPVAPDVSQAPPAAPVAPATAMYELRFDSLWRLESHPTDFPTTAHFSGLIGGTHDSAVSFWQDGQTASEGIRAMAERGRKTPLDAEVMAAISAGRAEFVLSGPDLPNSPGTALMTFTVSQAFPLVTVVTMVAPSPDWFVGVSGLPLFASGAWRENVAVDLFPFDAGTDSGVTYGAPDLLTSPRGPISRLTGYPVAHQGQVARFGTFTFRRIQ